MAGEAMRSGMPHSGPLDRGGPRSRVAGVVDAQLDAVQIFRRVELRTDVRFTGRMDREHSIFDRCIMMNGSANRISSGATAPAIGSITCIRRPHPVRQERERYVSQVNAGLSDVISRSDRLTMATQGDPDIARRVVGALLPPERTTTAIRFHSRCSRGHHPGRVQRAFPGVSFDTPEPSGLLPLQ